MSLRVNASRDLERFGGVDFWKWNQSVFFNVNTSRRISFGGRYFGGDQVFFDPAAPFLGRGTSGGFNVTLRPAARLQSEVSFDDPDRLVIVWQQDAQGDLREVSYREFPGWRDQARSFAAMTALGSVNWSFETSGSHGVST